MPHSWTFPSPSDLGDVRRHGREALPPAFYAADRTEEEIEASAAMMAQALAAGRGWVWTTYVQNATGFWLDALANERGIYRRDGESDETLRARVRTIEDAVTPGDLLLEVNRILAEHGLGPLTQGAIVELKRDRGWLGLGGDGHSRAFAGRGYRCGNDAPGRIIVVLPYGTTDAIAAAVSDTIRLKRAAGFPHTVEVRTSPEP